VRGLPISVRFDYEKKHVELACYSPMPFFESIQFQLTGIDPDDTEISHEIHHEPFQGDPTTHRLFGVVDPAGDDPDQPMARNVSPININVPPSADPPPARLGPGLRHPGDWPAA